MLTPVITSWRLPESFFKKVKASSRSLGLPNTFEPSATTVSEPITSASGYLRATVSAFRCALVLAISVGVRKREAHSSTDGLIHLKTDSQFLHGFTLGVIAGENHILEDATEDLYHANQQREHMEIKTHYEQIYLKKGLPITYLRFRLNY